MNAPQSICKCIVYAIKIEIPWYLNTIRFFLSPFFQIECLDQNIDVICKMIYS